MFTILATLTEKNWYWKNAVSGKGLDYLEFNLSPTWIWKGIFFFLKIQSVARTEKLVVFLEERFYVKNEYWHRTWDLPIPKCVFILAYRAVPVRFLFSLYGICWCVRGSRYFFARPKSIMYTRFPFLPRPMRKLSGFISLWMKFLLWIYSIRLI